MSKKEEQVKGFNKAYKKIKRLGFGRYYCLHFTTWDDAYNNFKKGMTLKGEASVLFLQENVNIVLREKKLPFCSNCHIIFSPQEFKAGFKDCEHCNALNRSNR